MKVSLLNKQPTGSLRQTCRNVRATKRIRISLPLTHLMFGFWLQVSAATLGLRPRFFLMVLVMWESSLHTNTQLHTHNIYEQRFRHIVFLSRLFTERNLLLSSSTTRM